MEGEFVFHAIDCGFCSGDCDTGDCNFEIFVPLINLGSKNLSVVAYIVENYFITFNMYFIYE